MKVARGGELDRLDVADGLERLFAGGVRSLPGMLRCVGNLRSDERQSWFQEESFSYVVRSALSRVMQAQAGYGGGWKDEVLCQEWIRASNEGNCDERHILRRFVMRALNRFVIEARGGVKDQLSKEGRRLYPQVLEERLSELIDDAAHRMLQRPSFKRLALTSDSRRPPDLHENLLVGFR